MGALHGDMRGEEAKAAAAESEIVTDMQADAGGSIETQMDPAPARDTGQQDETQAAAPTPEPKTDGVHDGRRAVIERNKRARAEREAREQEGILHGAPPEETADSIELDVHHRSSRPVGPKEGDAPADAPAAKIKLKVDHEEREFTQEELIAIAQQNLAADKRFEESKRVLAEAHRIANAARNGSVTGEHQTQDGPVADGRPFTRGQVDKAALVDIVEKIQLGDAEEGAEALASLLAGRNADPEEIAGQVAQVLRSQDAANEAATRYATAFPAMAADRRLASIHREVAHETLIEEMRGIGVEEQYLVQASADPDLALQWHQHYRTSGYAEHLSQDVHEVLRKAGDKVLQQYGGARAPAQQQPSRSETVLDEKRNLAPQPRRAAGPTAGQTAPQADGISQRRNRIAEIQKSRGQAVFR